MARSPKKPQTPSASVAELRAQLAEAQETIAAIRQGDVDALVVGEQVFSLAGAETPYRLLIEAMHEGAALLLRDGTVLYCNHRFGELAGQASEANAMAKPFQSFLTGEDLARLEKVLSGETKLPARFESTLQRPDGSRLPVQLAFSRITVSAPGTLCLIVTDLTERYRAAQALKNANASLEQRVAERTCELRRTQEELLKLNANLEQRVAERTAKLKETISDLEHLSYAIIHDMRAPLRAMTGFATIMEEDCAQCACGNMDLLNRIKVGAHRLDALITDSLNYSKAVRQELVLEPVDLNELISGLVLTYPNLHSDYADITLAPEMPVVLGNPAALTQCFANLLGNAVKFAKPGQKPAIRVYAESLPAGAGAGQAGEAGAAAEFVRVIVEDNGLGISPMAQGRIFDLFVRGTDTHEGTGLGLAIVKKVVQRMGGRVGVDSKEGQGSRFWVELRLFEV